MIGYLYGKVIHVGEDHVIVDVGGVGYKVFARAPFIKSLTLGASDIKLWIYTHVRENTLDLFGFATLEELDFFKFLLTLTGVGPKRAMQIISGADVAEIRRHAAAGDEAFFAEFHGLGRAFAKKLVFELKAKLPKSDAAAVTQVAAITSPERAKAVEALTALGYSVKEARAAVAEVPVAHVRLEDIVREALKLAAQQ